MKVARTVWGGGKRGDNVKGLPIIICCNKTEEKSLYYIPYNDKWEAV
ncbi:hypothetical protein bthur0007_36120 [Bacillus thuringiensis serovar monterrey BGSC 4AJ1]|nr:hypothetical protein bthur0007_36120 [Bacillus thuringiensis serovar monterrey BGSC 4AJ1]